MYSPLDRHREEAEEFYATDPEYREAAAELREIIWRIHDRVIALDLEGTLVCGEIESLDGDEVDLHDRVHRPLANEFAQALIDGNQVVIWTGLGAADASGVMHSAGLNKIFKTPPFHMTGPFNLPTIKKEGFKVSDQAEFVGHADYRSILSTLVAENHPFAQRFLQVHRQLDERRPLTPEDVIYSYARTFSIKIPSVLGADVLIDDAVDYSRLEGLRLYGPKEAARYIEPKAFRVDSNLTGYLRSDRALLEIARKLPDTLTEIDGLQDISIEDLGRRAEEEEKRRREAPAAVKSVPVKPLRSAFKRFLPRLLDRLW